MSLILKDYREKKSVKCLIIDSHHGHSGTDPIESRNRVGAQGSKSVIKTTSKIFDDAIKTDNSRIVQERLNDCCNIIC